MIDFNIAEVWMPCVGFPSYEVSSFGGVRKIKLRSGIKTWLILCQRPRNNGLYVVLREFHRSPISRCIHSLIAETFIGPRPDGCDIYHANDNGLDNRSANLMYMVKKVTHRIFEGDKQKFCMQCNEWRSINDFYKYTSRDDGLQTCCKFCKDDQNIEWAKTHKKERKGHFDRWRKKNPNYSKMWKANNKDKVAVDNHIRRARKIGAEGRFTASEWREKLAEYDHKCAYCGTTENMTRHHVIPLARGGSNWITNIVPACLTCNLRIATKIIQPGNPIS